ncbi:MAG: hypothetical protein GX442_15445 [Candidatus Riflebacteria bacterium]|nr:hypothetical protein [Candidatus Riflebacteria bacterium]
MTEPRKGPDLGESTTPRPRATLAVVFHLLVVGCLASLGVFLIDAFAFPLVDAGSPRHPAFQPPPDLSRPDTMGVVLERTLDLFRSIGTGPDFQGNPLPLRRDLYGLPLLPIPPASFPMPEILPGGGDPAFRPDSPFLSDNRTFLDRGGAGRFFSFGLVFRWAVRDRELAVRDRLRESLRARRDRLWWIWMAALVMFTAGGYLAVRRFLVPGWFDAVVVAIITAIFVALVMPTWRSTSGWRPIDPTVLAAGERADLVSAYGRFVEALAAGGVLASGAAQELKEGVRPPGEGVPQEFLRPHRL